MREPKPFYRRQTKCWYVQIGKKQVRLAADQDEAFQKYHALMAGRQAVTSDTPVIELLRRFLGWNKRNKKASTHACYERHVKSFGVFLGDRLTVAKLKPFHVTQWIEAEYKHAGDNYIRLAIRCVQRAVKWNVDEGYIDASPIAKVRKPAYKPRDTIVTPEQWEAVVRALTLRGVNGAAMLDLLTLMRQTGCRPLEARTCEARHFDRQSRCLVFEREESKGYGGKITVERRVVPLTDVAYDLCLRLSHRFPSGPMFRNSKGTPWTAYSIKECFKRLDQRRYDRPSPKRVDFRLSPYTLRHTWATEALERGVDPVTVATIMGHKDLTMLMKVYQHLQKKQSHLRTALHKALGS